MSFRTIKKKSSHFDAKIGLRKQAIALAENKNPRILDCYHGNGEIYGEIAKTMSVDVLGIDIKESSSQFPCLRGDNREIVKSLCINDYDVIDLDAYTDPTELLKYLIPLAKTGTVFIYTFCINRMAGTPRNLTGGDKISASVKTIENKYINEKWSSFLKTHGVEKYHEVIFSENCFLKKYGYFLKK